MIGPKDQVRITLEVDIGTQAKLAINRFFAEQTEDFNRWVDDEVKRFDFEAAVRAIIRNEIQSAASREAQRRMFVLRDRLDSLLRAEIGPLVQSPRGEDAE